MASDPLNDKENQFRKRARRRLIGAIALVLLMVTVLPMVLDDRSNQKSSSPEIAISIPSQDGADFSSKIVPVAPQASTPAPAPVQMASPVEKPQEATPVAQPAVESRVPEKAKPSEVTKPVTQAPVEEKPATPNVEAAAKTAKPAVVPQPEQKSQVVSGATPAKGSVSVQIGVFSDAAKVKQMRGKIAEKGIQCYTEDMNTPKGVKIRLRCGPYAGKLEAQQALEMLKAMGHNGILVTNQ
jgi:DedD protein